MRIEEQEISYLLSSLRQQSIQIKYLQELVGSQAKQISEQREKIPCLETEILRLKTPKKNSRNSSISPSQDPFRPKRTSSLRTKSGNQQGGQSGHPGSTLEMSSTPDVIVNHEPEYCHRCGGSLTGVISEYAGSRQIIDIPRRLLLRIYTASCVVVVRS
jgi:transposase